MNVQEALTLASSHLRNLTGHVFDLLTISKPTSLGAAVNLAKVVSKLSPLLGNLIEFNVVDFLNAQPEYRPFGRWERQDPDFPDTVLIGSIEPTPGFEIKAWLPLATEITARFKDSQKHFTEDQTNVCMLAWLPDQLIFGKPRIIDVCIVSGRSVAEARDNHYHNPPDYLVLEPEDTTERTRNLQQTNTNGHKFQGTPEELVRAQQLVDDWGQQGRTYQLTPGYQAQLRHLLARFPYRLDTNFAKMDRIRHDGIEDFKRRVLDREFRGLSISEWSKLLYRGSKDDTRRALEERLEIREENAGGFLR